MKCQNCGNNEVSFRYSQNINGRVAEALLCSDCAEKLGYLDGGMFGFTMPPISGMMAGFFGNSRAFGYPGPAFGFPAPRLPRMMALPVYFVPVPKAAEPEAPQQSADGVKAPEIEVSDEIKKRRELTMLREQMKKAVDDEAFEKAAQLRDEIKKLESAA